MPPEIVSLRITSLPREEYAKLAEDWRGFAKNNPTSAIAQVELSRAMRYANQGTPDEREALVRKALELDPNCPEALEAMGFVHFSMKGDRGEARRVGEKAAGLAPQWPEPHFLLTSIAMVEGQVDETRKHLQALLDLGALPSPLLDFAYNLLVSAEPNAVLFTNGDNDTYPPLALQLIRGVRPDVRVVNLSLLNLEPYAKNVWKSPPGSPAPFTDADVARLFAAMGKEKTTKGLMTSQVILQDLTDRVAKGSWTGPVYLALTVTPNFNACCEHHLQMEGLLWRVHKDLVPAASGAEDCVPIDAVKTLHLFRSEFRVDSATDLAYPWGPTSSISRLMINYAAVLQSAATALVDAKSGDPSELRYALGKAIEILKFHGEAEKAEAAAKTWKTWNLNAK